MRVDKLLSDLNFGTRSELKTAIRKGALLIGGQVIKDPGTNVSQSQTDIVFKGKPVVYQEFYYYMLNKPQGVISATEDTAQDTVLKLLGDLPCKNLFPVGRLDKDTEGLLLISNDGPMCHRLLSPKKHVDKCYYVKTREDITENALIQLQEGVDIGDEKKTLPAKAEPISNRELLLTIQEGRYHQVKRMLEAVNNEVIFLKRITFGPLKLDPSLAPGQWRFLTQEEIHLLSGSETTESDIGEKL